MPVVGKGSVVFGNSKSADFCVTDRNGEIYFGTQKYIKQSGGAQDNQISDVEIFVKNANLSGKKTIVSIDGCYGKSKIKYISSLCGSMGIVLTADQLKEKLLSGELK